MITPKDKALANFSAKVEEYFAEQRAAEERDRLHNKVRQDAVTTYNSCQMLPSQMLDKLRAAKDLLRRYNMNGQSSTLDADVFNFLSNLQQP